MKLLEIEKSTLNEYYDIVDEILNSKEFQKRKEYMHHGKQSVYDHCLKVSIISYKISKILELDYKSAAIGGLLHDFYDKPWQNNKTKTTFFKQHGFVHAKQAVNNTKKHFPQYYNKKVGNIILRHMFPLNIVPPRYLESWIISSVDKYVSMEIFNEPSKLLMYIGIKVGVENE